MLPPNAFSPELQLRTLFVLNEKGRITGTREPDPLRGPRFSLIRSASSCAWAVRHDMTDEVAARVDSLAREERPAVDFEDEPIHADQYVSLLRGRIDSGPAFTFPENSAPTTGLVSIDDITPLLRYFHGWTKTEIPERLPIIGIIEDGHAISVCFCARRSESAAEAGIETAEQFRGRGLASRVAAAWAAAIRATGRLPIYSTSWSNKPSLAVARKLGLVTCANDWNLVD